MAVVLTVLNQQNGESREVPLGRSALSIGKSSDNDVILPLTGVSRRHCRIERHGSALVVRDAGSRNGTFLDGRRLDENVPMPFASGQVLQIGEYLLRLSESDRNPQRPSAQAGAVRKPRKAGGQGTTPPAGVRSRAAVGGEPRRVTPVELKREVHARLLERMDLKHKDMTDQSPDELRLATEQVCTHIVQELAGELPTWLMPADLVKEVVDEAVGLGLLEDLLDDEEVDEIMVVGWSKVYVERRGKLSLSDKQFTDDQQVIAIMRRILAPIGRRIDETSPMADGRLQDGSRVNAIVPPLALSGPTLTIRKFAANPFTLDDLITRFHSLTPDMGRFLSLAVENRANILISGGTGSGKTTLLNVTSNFIPRTERIVTIEDAAELQLQQEHLVRLESRPANIEGRNAINIRDLVRNALRMRPDRIVVGECRGGEALDMLQAMNTGHDGSLTTLHANSPRDALARLETLVLMAGMELPTRAIREQVNSAINFIVQIARLLDGSRRVTNITAVTGMEGDIITLQDIFSYEQKGFDEDGNVIGAFRATGAVPEFVQKLRQRGIDVDLDMFKETSA